MTNPVLVITAMINEIADKFPILKAITPSSSAAGAAGAAAAGAAAPGAPGMLSWVVGKTKVFFRTVKMKYALEEARSGCVDVVAMMVQKVVRGHRVRVKLRDAKRAREALMGEARRSEL